MEKTILELAVNADSFQRHDTMNAEVWNREVLSIFDDNTTKDKFSSSCRQLLVNAGNFFSKDPSMPTEEMIYRQACKLYKDGCRDPMAIYLYGSVLIWYQQHDEAFQVLLEHESLMAASPYANYRKYHYYYKLFIAGTRNGVVHPEFLELAEAYALRAMNLNEFNGREILFADQFTDRKIHKNARALLNASCLRMIQATPEDNKLRIALEISYHLNQAWIARGGGYASSVTETGRNGWNYHLNQAYTACTKGVDIPELCSFSFTGLITVSLGVPEARENVNLWYLAALESDFNNRYAYFEMTNFMRGRWFGSTEELLQMGRILIETERYDTYAPLGGLYFYSTAIEDQFENDPLGAQKYYQKSKDTKLLIEAMEQVFTDPHMRRDQTISASYLCHLYYVTGQLTKAKRVYPQAEPWFTKTRFNTTHPRQWEAIKRELKSKE